MPRGRLATASFVYDRLWLCSGPPGLAGLVGMFGGGGGAAGGGDSLAAALNSMMQSPEMQALATQLQTASDGGGRVPSSVAVEERHPTGDTTMPDAPSPESIALISGGGANQPGLAQMLNQPGLAQMMGAVMQSPALRQIADDPEMQRAARRLAGGERCAQASGAGSRADATSKAMLWHVRAALSTACSMQ